MNNFPDCYAFKRIIIRLIEEILVNKGFLKFKDWIPYKRIITVAFTKVKSSLKFIDSEGNPSKSWIIFKENYEKSWVYSRLYSVCLLAN